MTDTTTCNIISEGQQFFELAPAQIRPRETATIRVNGMDFQNWESVYVQIRWAEPYPIFRFVCAEDVPVPNYWTQAQFQPGDECAIYLGGQLAISGIILIRQTAYDANSHGVTLQGVGLTWFAARASHIDKDGNFDNMTYKQIVERVLAPFESKPCYVGEINETPFKEAQINPGETIWDFFERLGRNIGVIVGSNQYGQMLFIGDHTSPVTGRCVEGENILRCQAIISIENWFNEYIVRNQQQGHDEMNGPMAAEQEAIAPGRLSHYSPLLTPTEQPIDRGMLHLRAANEQKWHDGTIVRATIEVQGWFRYPDNSGLWQAGDDVEVYSPSAMITQVMKIETLTFTQDSNQGTKTTLDLVVPWLLNNVSEFDVTNPAAPKPLDQGGSLNTQPATAPQSVQAPELPADWLE
jgi:prophage tail gpP-like protein